MTFPHKCKAKRGPKLLWGWKSGAAVFIAGAGTGATGTPTAFTALDHVTYRQRHHDKQQNHQ